MATSYNVTVPPKLGVHLYVYTIHPIIFIMHVCNIGFIVTRRRLHTAGNWMLASLSLSDAILLVLLSIRSYWCRWNERDCVKMIPYLDCPVGICYTSSVLSTLGISIDRYISVQYSLRYHSIVTKNRVKKSVAFVWIFSSLLSISGSVIWVATKQQIFFDISHYVVHLPCCIFLLVCSTYIRGIRNMHVAKITQLNRQFGLKHKQLHILWRLQRSMIGLWRLNVTTAVIVFCVTVLSAIWKYGVLKGNPVVWVLLRTVFLFYLVSNPIIYVLVTNDLRKEYKAIFRYITRRARLLTTELRQCLIQQLHKGGWVVGF